MALGKQAKTLTSKQVKVLLHYVGGLRNGLRNRVVVLLSVKAGLRAKEISSITWSMVIDADGNLGENIRLENVASKGTSGRVIPMNDELRRHIQELLDKQNDNGSFLPEARLIQTERSECTTAQVIVNMFHGWFSALGLSGCSSHSGRRTFITNAARKVSTVGGSIRDVQLLAGHSSLQTTQRYIESESNVRRKLVNLV
ncbi:site-specific integrase [Aliiroseovarius sp. PrR006]|uniref:tyrosine-type recombinase/integrase n=1 Tax=Aliiroseovarius sp. PrR006 TaxID=2706883 RepID=UPI0013CFDC5B|nr:site-specific integrase [Aliiroseovarius sp. PrR006]NDW52129.1 site-specific integrase [Aliiroseovarius sp. PrR006]